MNDSPRVKEIEERISEIKKTMVNNADIIDRYRRQGRVQPRVLVEANLALANEQRDLIIESNRLRGITLSIRG